MKRIALITLLSLACAGCGSLYIEKDCVPVAALFAAYAPVETDWLEDRVQRLSGFQACMGGPKGGIPIEQCVMFDFDHDWDVDMADWAIGIP